MTTPEPEFTDYERLGDPEVRQHLWDAIIEQASVREACDKLNISRLAVYRRTRKDEAFAAKLDEAWSTAFRSTVAKWQAAGEMWRLELMQEFFICEMDALLTDKLSGLREEMMVRGNGLTNRQRREIISLARRRNRALTEEFFPYLKKVS